MEEFNTTTPENNDNVDVNNIIKKRRPKKEKSPFKMPHWLKVTLWIFSIVVTAVLLATVIIIGTAEYLGIGPGRGVKCVVEVQKGMSTRQISHELKESGAINNELAFRIFSKLKGFDGKYSYGVYTFNNEIGYNDLAEMLMTQGQKAETVTVKIPEFATIDEIAVLLSDAGVCSKSDFFDAVKNGKFNIDFVDEIPAEKLHYRLEGYLFPDTYSFYSYESKECAYLAVEKMLKALESKFDEEMLNALSKSKYSFHEIITMASIIESESANGSSEERSKVAAVFYNRLEGRNWNQPKLLQSDPSTFYPYGNGRYNTYKTEGLPVGPIGAPSLNSIKAALFPMENFNATYFVTDKNANFYFNETLAGHNQTIANLKSQGLWLYTQLGS